VANYRAMDSHLVSGAGAPSQVRRKVSGNNHFGSLGGALRKSAEIVTP
jgi:hypothetical protein